MYKRRRAQHEDAACERERLRVDSLMAELDQLRLEEQLRREERLQKEELLLRTNQSLLLTEERFRKEEVRLNEDHARREKQLLKDERLLRTEERLRKDKVQTAPGDQKRKTADVKETADVVALRAELAERDRELLEAAVARRQAATEYGLVAQRLRERLSALEDAVAQSPGSSRTSSASSSHHRDVQECGRRALTRVNSGSGSWASSLSSASPSPPGPSAAPQNVPLSAVPASPSAASPSIVSDTPSSSYNAWAGSDSDYGVVCGDFGSGATAKGGIGRGGGGGGAVARSEGLGMVPLPAPREVIPGVGATSMPLLQDRGGEYHHAGPTDCAVGCQRLLPMQTQAHSS